MSACPFKVGETYKTRSGKSARVLHICAPGRNFPMVCLHEDEEIVISHTLSGSEYWDDESDKDLIPPAPPTVRVPLGPEDVPPGSVVRYSTVTVGWQAVEYVSESGLGFRAPISGVGHWNWKECMAGGMMIKVPGGDWQPMWKEIPADATPDEIAVKERWAKDIAEGRMAP